MSSTPNRPPQLTDWHLAGEAAIYLRQSSMVQVRENVGSALYQRSQVELLKGMGFPENRIRLIDEDLGQSGTSTKHRTGWRALNEDIMAGVVRVVAASEVSRLGRDDLDLAKFLWLCEWKGVLLLEGGHARDLREVGDWTLMKIQAVLAEQENRRKSQRIQGARTAKALTGIPAYRLACGFERGPNGEAVKTANAAVREILDRVWREALQGWSTGRIVKGLRKDGLPFPVRGPKGNPVWVPPTRSAVRSLLHNPLYAGYVVLWQHRMDRGPDGRKRMRRTSRQDQQWVQGKVEAYVSPEEFERVQALLAARHRFNGVPLGEGAALCAGLVHCGRHGQRLHVAYKPRSRKSPHRDRSHGYVCPGSRPDQDPGPYCMRVCGRMLDRAVEAIVLSKLRCPSLTTLRYAIKEENERRQATGRGLLAESQRAKAGVAEARARLEESRQRGRNPNVTQMYEDELEKAMCLAKQAERRMASTPTPALIDDSPAFLSKMTAVFDELPRLWRLGRLGPRDRKAVARLVVRRIDIPEKGEPIRALVTLHTGAVLERVLFGLRGRRRLIETMTAEGFTPDEIAGEMRQRGILNVYGRPFNAAAVKRVLRPWRGPRQSDRERVAAIDALRALWNAGLLVTEIAERLNAQGFQTRARKPWTWRAVLHAAHPLGLPSRKEIVRAAVRAALTGLVTAGWDDAAIARELTVRDVKPYTEAPWNARAVERERLALGIRRPSGRKGEPRRLSPSGETSS